MVNPNPKQSDKIIVRIDEKNMCQPLRNYVIKVTHIFHHYIQHTQFYQRLWETNSQYHLYRIEPITEFHIAHQVFIERDMAGQAEQMDCQMDVPDNWEDRVEEEAVGKPDKAVGDDPEGESKKDNRTATQNLAQTRKGKNTAGKDFRIFRESA